MINIEIIRRYMAAFESQRAAAFGRARAVPASLTGCLAGSGRHSSATRHSAGTICRKWARKDIKVSSLSRPIVRANSQRSCSSDCPPRAGSTSLAIAPSRPSWSQRRASSASVCATDDRHGKHRPTKAASFVKQLRLVSRDPGSGWPAQSSKLSGRLARQ